MLRYTTSCSLLEEGCAFREGSLSTDAKAFVADSFDFIADLEKIDDLRELEDALGRHFARCGIEHYAMARLPPPGQEKMAPLHLVDRWPKEWLDHYDRSKYVRHDPVMDRLVTSFDPFAWSGTPVDRRDRPTAFRIMNEATEFGLVEGYSIPIVDPAGLQGCISLAGPRIDPQPDVLRAVHMVSIWAFGVAERIVAAASAPTEPLTDREREVLRWIATGHSQAKVADVLGLAERTIEAHLRSARIKLRCRNTVQAAVVALQRRLIRL